ncbi:MAG TPA: hypothetical protein VFH56_17170 [Acidimicrobiales bacterium]|nr:hypothetical protein [Acidimicrobiales bacterium]
MNDKNGMRIDPDAFYSPQDVQWGLRINHDAQEAARRSGALKHSVIGGRGNEHVVYQGKHLIAWLTATGN